MSRILNLKMRQNKYVLLKQNLYKKEKIIDVPIPLPPMKKEYFKEKQQSIGN
jgi:hypothetical protein